MTDIKYIPIEEFRDLGYLQEVNRRFLHPLGLALEVVLDNECKKCGGTGFLEAHPRHVDCPDCENGILPRDQWVYRLGGIWDYRDDPEGIVFGGVYADNLEPRASEIDRVWETREKLRVELLGFMVQPPDGGGVNVDDAAQKIETET